MTAYDIFIDYTTGDSFGSERINGESVGIVTTDLAKAKENLRRIREHHDNNGGLVLKLLTDEGEREIMPFWVGYFETLHGAKIAPAEDPEMSFEVGF